MTETKFRECLVAHARSLFDRGYAHGSSGNLSVRIDDGILVTPTGSSLGRLDPAGAAESRRGSSSNDGAAIASDALRWSATMCWADSFESSKW